MKDGEYMDEILRTSHRKQLRDLVRLYEEAAVRNLNHASINPTPATTTPTTSIRAKLHAKVKLV